MTDGTATNPPTTSAEDSTATSTAMSDGASTISRRSSSQASHASSGSKKVKTGRGPKRQSSRPTITPTASIDPALTSFPSFLPETNAFEHAVAEEPPKPLRTISQKVRERKATLAGLTNASSGLGRQNALFDDSPRPSLDIPGSLHLASDEHIERLITKTGAAKLVRQYAQDLARRDAELSTLRIRADNRERELKRLLREADVPSAEVEKRLLRIDRSSLSHEGGKDDSSNAKRRSAVSLDGMISEAMMESQSLSPITSHANPVNSEALSRVSSTGGRRQSSLAAVDPAQNSTVTSRASSRANSIGSQQSQDVDATLRPRQASSQTTRLTGLQSMFQQPAQSASYFIGGSNKTIKKTKAGDELSIRSNQSAKSVSSWTTRLFGNAAQPGRARASSLGKGGDAKVRSDDTKAASDHTPQSRGKSNMASSKSASSPTPSKAMPASKRVITATRLSTSPQHTRKDSNASSLPPTVEMDSMVESSQLPPTMTNTKIDGVLTDAFGFIYDRKRKRQQLNTQNIRHRKNRSSAAETLASFRNDDVPAGLDSLEQSLNTQLVEQEASKKSWSDYLMPSSTLNKGRPKELLAHTPSAGAVVTVSTADATGTITPPRLRDSSISVSSTTPKVMPSTSSLTEPRSSVMTAASTGVSSEVDEEDASEFSASKALLDQLKELHNTLQAERKVKWNEFLRRVRAERASTSDRTTNNAPEADLVNGELVGIATLGRSSKTKAKYLSFKALVLTGIPVELRPKVWAECSGATSMRIPGYYDDIVSRSEEGEEMNEEIESQIKADVRRTLRDNVYFRSPQDTGSQRLEEVLRAYSLHNPRIGYCQGMNLITASLVLICATAEDCFWLLVAIIDHILPSGYFDQDLLVARADQTVLREYVAEVLPRLDGKLQDVGVELEACTFHWFLSLYTGVLTGGEALYRVWDVVLCLNSSDTAPIALQNRSVSDALAAVQSQSQLQSPSQPQTPTTASTPVQPDGTPSTTTTAAAAAATGDETSRIPTASDRPEQSQLGAHDGTSSPFLFQLSLALLKLNEDALLALDSPATIYTYLNHNMTAHNITIDALISASEALRSRLKRSDVLDRRRRAVEGLTGV